MENGQLSISGNVDTAWGVQVGDSIPRLQKRCNLFRVRSVDALTGGVPDLIARAGETSRVVEEHICL